MAIGDRNFVAILFCHRSGEQMQANKSVDTKEKKSPESNVRREKISFSSTNNLPTENEIFSSMNINRSIWRALRVRHPLCRIHRTSIVLHSAIAEDVLQFLIYIVTIFFLFIRHPTRIKRF